MQAPATARRDAATWAGSSARSRVWPLPAAAAGGAGTTWGSASATRAADEWLPPLVHPGRHGAAPSDPYTFNSSTGKGSDAQAASCGSSGVLQQRIMEAPNVEQLQGLLPALAAAPRPHLISIAWVALAQLASKELAAAAATPAAPLAAGGRAHSNGARGGQGGVTAAMEAEVAAVAARVVEACGQLQLLTRDFMGSMQFAQLSGLFWAWGRLVQSVGAQAVGARMVEAAAARVAACRTDDEAQGRIPSAALQLARLSWGAATLRALHPPLWRKVAALAAPLAADAGAREAAGLMWALGRARALEGAAAEALSARALALAPLMGAKDLANVAWALGAARERRRALLPALAAAAGRLQGELGPEELAGVSWGFARLWGARRRAQQDGRGPLLRALAAAGAGLASQAGVRQAATVAWALATLAGPRGRRRRQGAEGGGAAGGEGPEEVAWAAIDVLLARVEESGLQGAPLPEVCMLIYTAARAGSGGCSEARARGAARPELLLDQIAAWVLSAQEPLRADAVAMLLFGFRRARYFELSAGGTHGGGGEGGQLSDAVSAALVGRASALAAAGAFAPLQLPRLVAALGTLASPARLQQRQAEFLLGGDVGRSGGGTPDLAQAVADEARATLERLALPAAAVAGRLKLRALADVACGYAAAGLHPEELFDAISEGADRSGGASGVRAANFAG
ncbi:hypothetical protein MNEG_14672 [Monoraphidium neglectum]|uniref:Uncharacterized protein n=1 Tax=Monoraphidium neglectum TaxID=145388 RepID=A0A0D2MDJ5_9CHLO|nr:hypothetical protein MNEG_14672 [Monoraphidium neglectum]KIY93290.1 hypothetical protein MNEG_14672 [Monoraphidium neglectum]|eukprot:XP_013892310.1 hypothetical protein MNEG_14672 [Monoraphidium neglectum]